MAEQVCFRCGGPASVTCDCWKDDLSPQRREEIQMMLLAKHLAKLDQRKFEARQATRPTAEQHVRGQFGNTKAGNRDRRTA